ncbi:hypothetical protein HAX54_052724, partial [Datura stramonium]|nr:hypothetical protein [Datura stramonium]
VACCDFLKFSHQHLDFLNSVQTVHGGSYDSSSPAWARVSPRTVILVDFGIALFCVFDPPIGKSVSYRDSVVADSKHVTEVCPDGLTNVTVME